MSPIDKVFVNNLGPIKKKEFGDLNWEINDIKSAMKEYSILEAKKILRRILRHSNNDLISISTRIIFEIELLKEKSK